MTQTLSIRPVIVISKLSTAWQAAQWQTKTPCGDSNRHIHVGSEHRHSYIAKAWEACCIKVGGLACVRARATLMVMGEVNDDDYILRSTPTRNSWGAETPWENAVGEPRVRTPRTHSRMHMQSLADCVPAGWRHWCIHWYT